MRGRTSIKGTVFAKVAAREGQIVSVDIDSEIRDVSLRWCFRKSLSSLAVAGGPFEGRLEFFIMPRTVPVRGGR